MTINAAIWEVIKTKRKKDMIAGAFEMVKKAGYEVRYRGSGEYWEVRSPITYKCVYVHISQSYYGRDYVSTGNRNVYIKTWDFCPIDFEKYLNTPINKEYYSLKGWRCEYAPTKHKYDRLTDSRWSVKYKRETVEKLKKEITSKQKELEETIKDLANRERDLKELRMKYRLIK